MRRTTILGLAVALVALPTIATAAGSSPSVTTGAASSVTSSAATVHGTVNPEGQSTQYAFQYGTSNSYGHETALKAAGAGTSSLAVSTTIGGLTAGTTYHYRLIAISAAGTSTGSDQTFKTTGTAPRPTPRPSVVTGTASALTPTSAKVSGTVNPNGVATTYHFEFGPTSAYGYQTKAVSAGSGTHAVDVSATLAGLGPNQTYHYRLVGVSQGGTTLGGDAQFTTTSPPPGASRLTLFGRTGFMSRSGIAGVFMGCIGGSPCSGSISISRGGLSLGSRPLFQIAANDGGVVHVALNGFGRAEVGRRGVRVNVVVQQAGGPSTAGIIRLVRF